MPLDWKPEDEQLRLLFTSERPRCMSEERDGAVYAVIGPFKSFSEQSAFKEALTMFVRGFNLKNEPK